jgi:hypothetical protein
MTWDDIPPFHRFMISAVALNMACGREIDAAYRSGRFPLLHRLIALTLWMWAMTIMVHELEDMLMPRKGVNQ